MTAAAVVVLPPLDGQQAQAWDTLMAVAEDLGAGWTAGLGRSADGGQQRCTRAVPSIGSQTLAFRSNGVSLAMEFHCGAESLWRKQVSTTCLSHPANMIGT